MPVCGLRVPAGGAGQKDQSHVRPGLTLTWQGDQWLEAQSRALGHSSAFPSTGERWRGQCGPALKPHGPGLATLSVFLLSLDILDAKRKPSQMANAYFSSLVLSDDKTHFLSALFNPKLQTPFPTRVLYVTAS